MLKLSKKILVEIWVLGITLAPSLLMAEEPAQNWRSTSGVSVTTGDYGTGDDTTIVQLSQAFKYRTETGELGIVVPYLFRDGAGVTPGESRRARNRAIPSTADGIGDVQLKGKYFWLQESNAQPAVDLAGRVKLPTASEEDGLGTGHVDVGFGPELSKQFGSWTVFGDLELVLRDKPSDSTLRTVRLDYSVGAGYPITERVTAMVSLDGGTPTNSGADAPLEMVFSGRVKTSENTNVDGFVLAGLTDGSPDFGAGASVTFKF